MLVTTPITLSTFLTERDISRFWSRVALPDAEGHLLWTAHRNEYGYGQIRISQRACYAHRISYVIANGEIPPGLVIDHICRTPACVAPDHLELVTQAENLRRSRKTYCLRGHALEGANAYIRPDTQARQCRACRAVRRQEGKRA